jgi:hypothetical protein
MEKLLFDFLLIRLRFMMEAANQTVDSRPQLHAEIAASKEFLVKHGYHEAVDDLVELHEKPWVRG